MKAKSGKKTRFKIDQESPGQGGGPIGPLIPPQGGFPRHPSRVILIRLRDPNTVSGIPIGGLEDLRFTLPLRPLPKESRIAIYSNAESTEDLIYLSRTALLPDPKARNHYKIDATVAAVADRHLAVGYLVGIEVLVNPDTGTGISLAANAPAKRPAKKKKPR